MSSEVMLAVGAFQFSVDSAAYQQLEKSHAWRWATYYRVNNKPAQQFQGADSSEITLDGTIYIETTEDAQQIADMKTEGDKGEPLRLISGSAALGRDWGLWVMVGLTERQKHLLPDGTPLKQEFTLRLKEYGEDNY